MDLKEKVYQANEDYQKLEKEKLILNEEINEKNKRIFNSNRIGMELSLQLEDKIKEVI